MSGSDDIFNPFPGLRPFRAEDKPVFFGREPETMELLRRLNSHRFLAAVGPSGSGKSSLIYAGLLPELHGGTLTQAGAHWRVAEFRPAGNPVGELARALVSAELHPAEHLDLLIADLRRSGLGLIDATRHARLPANTNLLVLVDQFEELFRFSRKNTADLEAATAFVDLLLEAVRQSELPIYVVLTMRADFLGDCAQFPGLAEAVNQSQYLIPRLNRDQWRAAIEGPVCVGGGRIAPRLVQRLLADVADSPDQLPVLQHALMRTWDHWEKTRQGNEPLDLKHYESPEVGTLAHALSHHADEVFRELAEGNARQQAERIFKTLTELGSGQRGIRRPARVAELAEILAVTPDEVAAVINPFRRQGRTFLMPPPDRTLGPDTVIDISHESLMRVWVRLRTWTEEEAHSVRIYRRLAETARLWKAQREGLYRDPALALAREWKERNQPNRAWAARHAEGFEAALEFLEASRQAQEAELQAAEEIRQRELAQAHALAEEQRRRANAEWASARRLRFFLAGLAALLAVIVMLAGSNWREKRIALSRQLSAVAANYFEEDPELSVSLALEALKSWHTPSAEFTLRQAVSRSTVRAVWEHPEEKVNHVRFSRDGTFLATGGNRTVRLHRRATPPTEGFDPGRVLKLPETITDLAFSPSGRWLAVATGGQSNAVTVWDTATGQSVAATAFRQQDRIRTARFSADEERIVTASQDPRLGMMVWPWRNGAPRPPYPDDGILRELSAVNEIALHPSLPVAASAGADHVLRVWDLTTGQSASTGDLQSTNPLHCVAFSPDGTRLVTGNARGEASVYAFVPPAEGRLSPPQRLVVMPHPEAILQVEFSPDGAAILTRSSDSLARVWSTNGTLLRSEIGRVNGALPTVLASHFSPDGQWVIAGLGDKRARLWKARENGDPVAVFSGHADQVQDVAFDPVSPDPSFVSAAHDGTARLWAIPVGRATSLAPTGDVESISLTRDGRHGVMLVNRDGANAYARAFRTSDGASDPDWPDLGPVALIALSPEGSRLAAVTKTRETMVWSRGTKAGVRLDCEGTPRAMSFSASARAFGVLADQTLQIWKLAPPPAAAPAPPVAPDFMIALTNASTLSRLAFAPDETVVLVLDAEDQAFRVRIGSPPVVSPVWPRRKAETTTLAFGSATATGWPLLAGEVSGAVRLWNLSALGTPPAVSAILRAPGHSLAISSVAWSTDGRFLLSGATDQTARIWDPSRQASFASLGGHRGYVYAVALDSARAELTTAGSDGTLRTYRVPETLPYEALVKLARERVPSASRNAQRVNALLTDQPSPE